MLRQLSVVIVIIFTLQSDVKFSCMGVGQSKIEETVEKVANYLVSSLNSGIKYFDDLTGGYADNIISKTKNPFSSRPSNVNTIKNTTTLIKKHGYKVETHLVVTIDTYVLKIQRIIASLNRGYNQSVILHHGLLGSADDWLLLGPGKALPYVLSDHGYDVWLLNARGNKYSRMNFAPERPYWDFSWHEIGFFDLPAAITYISDYTNNELNFIGHSMGATALLVLLSTRPEYNIKLKSAFLMAPLVHMYHVKGPLRHYAWVHSTEKKITVKQEEVKMTHFPTYIINKYCNGNGSCRNVMLFITNGGRYLMDIRLMKDILQYTPAGGSVKTVLHYMQLIRSGNFEMFDYGIAGNLEKYKQESAPKYNLHIVNVPSISIFSAHSDYLAGTIDVSWLIPQLKQVKNHYVVREDNFTHMDFLWSQYASKHVYTNILNTLLSLRGKKGFK